MRVKMKAKIYYLTKEMRKNPDTWMGTAETERLIKSIPYCEAKRIGFAMVHELNNVNETFDIAECQKCRFPFQALAEQIWALMNGMAGGEDPNGEPNPLANPEGQKKIKELGVGHTSMSVGDFIVLFPSETDLIRQHGKILVADSMGFKEIDE